MIQRMNEYKLVYTKANFFMPARIADTGQTILCKKRISCISFFWILKLYKTYFLVELWSSKCITFYYNTKVILRCCYIQIYCCREWLFIAYLLLLAPKDSRQKCYFFLFYWTKRFLKSICGDPQFLDFLISQSS